MTTMAEGAFSETLLRSNIIYYISPPVVHLNAYATGGYKGLYNNINNPEEVDISDQDVFTDSEGRFMPKMNMPPMARRYQFLDIIGSGQSAIIIRTKDLFCGGTQVAIKVLNIQFCQLGAQEADCVRRINKADPNGVSGTIRLKNIFNFEGHYCMVYELLDPLPLHKYLIHTFNPKKRLDSVRKVAASLLKSLGFLQQQKIIHGDLKPENILLKKKADFTSVTVLDFGNAIRCVHEELSLYYDNFDFQTLLYRAPEVIYGIQFDLEVDMWSYGCILAELYMGRPLFDGSWNKQQILSSIVELLGPLPNDVFIRGKYFRELQRFTEKSQQCDSSIQIMNKLGICDFDFANFLSACLKFDPGKRLTVWEAAQMPFLATHYGYTFIGPQSKQTNSHDKHHGIVSKEAYHERPRISNPGAKHMSSLELLKYGSNDKTIDNFIKEKNGKVFNPWKKITGIRKVAQVIPFQRNTPSPTGKIEQQNVQSQSSMNSLTNSVITNSMNQNDGQRTIESNSSLSVDPMFGNSNISETTPIAREFSSSDIKKTNITPTNQTLAEIVLINKNLSNPIIKPLPMYGHPNLVLQSPKDKYVQPASTLHIKCESDNHNPSSSVSNFTSKSSSHIISKSLSKCHPFKSHGQNTSAFQKVSSERYHGSTIENSGKLNEDTLEEDNVDYDEHIINMLNATSRLLESSGLNGDNLQSNETITTGKILSSNNLNVDPSSIDAQSLIQERVNPIDFSNSCLASKSTVKGSTVSSQNAPENELDSLHYDRCASINREITPSPSTGSVVSVTPSSGSVVFLTSESSCSNSPKENVCIGNSSGIRNTLKESTSRISDMHNRSIKSSLISNSEKDKFEPKCDTNIVSDEYDSAGKLHYQTMQKSSNTDRISTGDAPAILNETFTISPSTSNQIMDHSPVQSLRGNLKETGKSFKRNLASSFTAGEPKTKRLASKTEDGTVTVKENRMISSCMSQPSGTLQSYNRINKICDKNSLLRKISTTEVKTEKRSVYITPQKSKLILPKAQRIPKPINNAVDPIKQIFRSSTFSSPLQPKSTSRISNGNAKPSTPMYGRIKNNEFETPSKLNQNVAKSIFCENSKAVNCLKQNNRQSIFSSPLQPTAAYSGKASSIVETKKSKQVCQMPPLCDKDMDIDTDNFKDQFQQNEEEESDSGDESGPEIRQKFASTHTSKTLSENSSEMNMSENMNSEFIDHDKESQEGCEQVMLL